MLKLARLDGLIVDCGGGVIIDLDDSGNEVFSTRKVAALRAGGPIVFLEGDIARLAAKVADDPTRPSLDATRSAEEVMRRRAPLYRQAADTTLFVERESRPQVAWAIARRLEEGPLAYRTG